MKTTCMRKAFFKDFEIKNSSEYHDLHLKYDTLLLVNVFESVKKNLFKSLSFRSCKISFSSWISRASRFKKG